MRLSFTATISGLLVLTAAFVMPVTSRAQQLAPQCKPAGEVVRVPELQEGSGLDSNGRVAGRLQLSGAKVEDWEAIAVGPCAGGSCIYVGDIGDNDAGREQITIYRLAEPAGPSGSVAVLDVIRATYPDGAHDAEALLVAPDGRMFIVTKGETGPVALYRFPSNRGGTTVRLERVGGPRGAGSSPKNDRITDGAISPDGRWVVLRTTNTLVFYRAADLLSGNWREAGRVPLRAIGEPQGEGVAFGPDNAVYLMSEGGGKKQPGSFGRLTCTLTP
jgi:hypothetical protein